MQSNLRKSKKAIWFADKSTMWQKCVIKDG